MRLDPGFVAAMKGEMPALPKPPPLPVAAPIRRMLAGKRVVEPTREEIAAVDMRIAAEQLAEQGIYLSRETLRDLIAETNSALHRERFRRG